MIEGKIPENVLKRSILKELKVKNENVITGAAFGEDCAILNMNGDKKIPAEAYGKLGAATAFAEGKENAGTAIHKAANNLYASGFDFEFAEVSLMLREDTEEAEIKEVMREVDSVCVKLGGTIVGGHTAVLKNPTGGNSENEGKSGNILLSVTAFGRSFEENQKGVLSKKNISPGDSIVVSKQIGIEGALEILHTKRDVTADHFGESFLGFFEGYENLLSVKKESKIAVKTGAVSMKDASEHGIFGALWELASAANRGLKVDLKAIPVRQEIIEICNLFDINPYEMKSSGMLIMVTKEPDILTEALLKEGIPAAVIGTFTDNNDRIVINGEETRFLEKIKQDAVYKL
ncbi:MAG: hypothetical protein K5776_07900 [Lachnospiraceae bacterium]|nr:hypothetical protein [Lachnospiraceae bacterium]